MSVLEVCALVATFSCCCVPWLIIASAFALVATSEPRSRNAGPRR